MQLQLAKHKCRKNVISNKIEASKIPFLFCWDSSINLIPLLPTPSSNPKELLSGILLVRNFFVTLRLQGNSWHCQVYSAGVLCQLQKMTELSGGKERLFPLADTQLYLTMLYPLCCVHEGETDFQLCLFLSV